MTKHTRTAPPVSVSVGEIARTVLGESVPEVNRRQRQADALLDTAAPMRYVPSMGKRLRAESAWTKEQQKAAHDALVAWSKP